MRGYASYITLPRIVNELRCRISCLRSMMGKVRVMHHPTFISLEPANFCMLSCPQCPVGMKNQQQTPITHSLLSLNLCEKVLADVAKYAHTVIFYFQGEPLLNKELPQMIAMAHSFRLYTIVSTNALLLTKELAQSLQQAGLDKIIVSIDGFTQQSYEQYRVGGKLDQALAGLRNANIMPEVELQCLMLRSNEQEWGWIRKNYKSLGAKKLSMKSAQFYNFEDGNPLMPSDERYSRYALGKDGKYHLKHPLRRYCYRLWSGCVVDSNGVVLPCCFDKNHQHAFGQISANRSLSDVWFSHSANDFRTLVVKQREQLEICQNCTE